MLPSSPSPNPIIAYGLRQSDHHAVGVARKYSVVLVVITVLTLVGMVAAFIGSRRYSRLPAIPISYIGLWAIAFSIGADICYMTVAVTSINREMANGQWDLLKLTAMNERDIIHGKYMVALRQVNRVLSAVRLISLCAFVLEVIPSILPQLVYQTMTINGVDFPGYLPGYLPEIFCTFLVQVYWRPAWNMRLMVAASLTISASMHNLWSAATAGLILIPLLHVAAFFGPAILSADFAVSLYYAMNGSEFFLRAFIGVCIGGVLEYIAYKLLTSGSLRLARHNAFKPQ